jgi:hypothetical protein
VVALRRVVPEKSRAVIQIEDDHVDVAIVVVVAERSAATRLLQEEPAAHFGGDVAKAFAPQVPKQLLRLQVRRAQILTVDVGIHVAVCDEQIEEAVVVHVHEAHAPSHERGAAPRDASHVADVGEEPTAAVLIQCVVVVREVGDDQIEMPVIVVVRRIDAHSCLRAAVAAEGHAGFEALFGERTITIVVKEQIGH